MAAPPFPLDDTWRAGIANLRADVESEGLNFATLAQLSSVDRRMLAYLLNGKRLGSIATHRAIALAMDRDPGFYFPRTVRELERAEAREW